MWSVIDRGLARRHGNCLHLAAFWSPGATYHWDGDHVLRAVRNDHHAFAGFIATFGSIREAIGALARVTRTLSCPMRMSRWH